jgi:hypothetical protein
MQRVHLLGLLLVLLVFSGCPKPESQQAPPKPKLDRYGRVEEVPAVVIIDAQKQAHPDHTRVRHGQWMQFILSGGGQLDIQGADFLDQYGHDGPYAWGEVKGDAALGRHTYNAVDLNAVPNKRGSDPDVMIDPDPTP